MEGHRGPIRLCWRNSKISILPVLPSFKSFRATLSLTSFYSLIPPLVFISASIISPFALSCSPLDLADRPSARLLLLSSSSSYVPPLHRSVSPQPRFVLVSSNGRIVSAMFTERTCILIPHSNDWISSLRFWFSGGLHRHYVSALICLSFTRQGDVL